MSQLKWRITAITAALIACAILADQSNVIAGLCGYVDAECQWWWWDMGREVRNSIGWTIPLVLLPRIRMQFKPRILLYYLLTIHCLYCWVDVFDQLTNDNQRDSLPDVVAFGVAAAYGCVSFLVWNNASRMGHKPSQGNYYRIHRIPKNLLFVPFLILRNKREYLSNGKVWTKTKRGWELPRQFRNKRGVVLRYAGNYRELMDYVTDGMGN